MIESIIYLLITVCVIALVIYLVLWVLQGVLGIPLPAKVIQILWVIFALIVLLMLLRVVMSGGTVKLLKLSQVMLT